MEIIKINAKELADYIERIYNSETVKKIISNASNQRSGREYYYMLGHILTTYASATGDLSNETIERIAKRYEEHQDYFKVVNNNPYGNRDPIKLEPIQKFFGDFILPDITSIWMQRLSITSPLQISDILKINDAIYKQCRSNCFYTHSFSGALYDQISGEGLDISHEMFQEEYQLLSSLSDSPFKKGRLCFCELSKASFGYAVNSPERLSMILTNYGVEQEKDESNLEFFKRNLKIKVDALRNRLPLEQCEAIMAAGNKLIDFYYSNDKSCIGIIPREGNGPDQTDSFTNHIVSAFLNNFTSLNSFLYRIFKNDPLMRTQYSMVVDSIRAKEPDSYIKLQSFINEFLSKYPDDTVIKNIIQQATCHTVTTLCLNNFVHNGYADGYAAPDGKLRRNAFEIAVTYNPMDLMAKYNKGQSLT